jgi:hypothetical protein
MVIASSAPAPVDSALLLFLAFAKLASGREAVNAVSHGPFSVAVRRPSKVKKRQDRVVKTVKIACLAPPVALR